MNGNPRRLRLLLNVAGALGAVIGIAAIAWVANNPPTTSTTDHADKTKTHTFRDSTDHAIDLNAMQRIWDLPLRKPLYDPPPPVVEVKKFVPPPLPVRLTGTIVEPGQTLAMLKHQNGKVEFCNIGHKVGEIEVVEITDGQVKLLYYGKPVTLTLGKEGKG